MSSLIFSTECGDRSAADALFPPLHSELHRLAGRQLPHHAAGVTLGVTALPDEAYLNTCEREGAVFPDRGRFMAYAAKVLRRLIIDDARSRQAQKRGGGFGIMSLAAEAGDAETVDEKEVGQISEALESLAEIDPSLAEVVDLKFFSGFSFAELGAMRGVSERTVQRRREKAADFASPSDRTNDARLRPRMTKT